MGKMDALLLKSKFRGSMLGALMGDCLGSAYEGEELFSAGMKLVIQRSFDKLEGPHFKAPVMQFTDDSAMTSSVASSLIECAGFDQKDMATKFVKSYYQEPNRGYGAGVVTVFHKLRNNKFVDLLGPAKEQFNGEGSLGNGGAMRIAPVSLFCFKNYDLMVDIARKQSQITHTHKTGVDGAILQALAIHQSLSLDPKEKLDVCKFTDDLIAKMNKIEVDDEGLGLVNPSPYRSQLKLVKKFISEQGDGPHAETIVHQLGNDVSALHSVPTAIYCFLRAQTPIQDIQTDNPLRRAIQYATVNAVHGCVGHDSEGISSLKNTTQQNIKPCVGVHSEHQEYYSKSYELDYTNQQSLHSSSQFETKCPSADTCLRIIKQTLDQNESDYCSRYSSTNLTKTIVQFSLSNDSLLWEGSSTTIVCEKLSDYTCTLVRRIDREVQWRSSDNEHQTERKSRDCGIVTEYDEYDIFAKAIVSRIRAMDIETALQVCKQIQNVITDQLLHKPEIISLGGDTDTIGSMAGAISGAFFGEELIRPAILNHCEASAEFAHLADQLFDLASA